MCTYDILDRNGSRIGTVEWVSYKEGIQWIQTTTLLIQDSQETVEVVMDEALSPLSLLKQSPNRTIEAIYTPDQVEITTTTDGKSETKTIQRAENGWDNDQLLMLHRALPLAEGYTARYIDIIPATGAQMPVTLSVIEQEEIGVPAGNQLTWHLVMDFSSAKHDAWYAVEPPYLMVQYRNRSSGVEFQLRSWRAAEGQPLQGNPLPAEMAAAQQNPIELPPIDWLRLGITVLVQLPLMVAFPIGLGWWLRHRYQLYWRLFFAGGMVFIASQVVHLPLNWALGLLGSPRGAALLPLPWVALIAGLSSGICEEGARWVALRFFLRKDRGWKPALQLGAGHGGIEAILVGGLVFWGLINVLLTQSVGLEALGLKGNAAVQAAEQIKAYWSVEWYLPIFAGLERVFTITMHILMTVLVMRSFTRRNLLYLLAAIGVHTTMNAWAVWSSQQIHPGWVEFGLGLMAVVSLVFIIRLRDKDSQRPASSAG